ncbi:glycoside hydrolase 5 family protein [Hymenobacter jeollabukensis]|uniref:Glycoside hydrolase family 5 protein n=1 Tax=Hymenobacter jeollabukensis TaxID=2025313 RepID=A0A5R8WSQ7_9BACT|nr:glycoside hydrolase family 5 protein [Hymenobacter jeollabukensis]TLM94202.1 glycoside hydrolase family 5 protein [Hymenobacter jeollabukensis]
MNFLRFLLLLPLLCGFSFPASAQQKPTAGVFVDKQGVLRWEDTKREVALFGVNYTAPFAHAYRAHQAVGADVEQAIRQDVYHLARLGVDAFRVHVWDVEITDTLGNLQPNEHLRLLDFLLAELKQRGIKTILTPIAYWNNGYPEPDSGTGFSSIYSKAEAYVNPRAIAAQERYLTQFLNHQNPYTKLLLRDDPDIIAFEVCNEPRYHEPKAQVTDFANRMVRAMRATGLSKPIFYNIAENYAVHEAILDANVDGLTFQWYPQGLVSGHELRGNLLPYVDQYPIPYRNDPRFRRRARMVYEFESADVLQPIMYPMMARSFREAGFQWATQFAYDPLAIAPFNTEYQTHYLNLAYTPSKAISLLIAGKVFRTVRRNQQFRRYPADSVFGPFRVSYREQLSEMNTDEEFYYTNTTRTAPKKPTKLRHLAGVGSSPVVTYAGTGAYFLDRLAPGVWRLEVMPDAVPVRDPFEKTSLRKVVTSIQWNEQPLRVQLPDLGASFTLRGLDTGNRAEQRAQDGKLRVRPGTYLLAVRDQDAQKSITQDAKVGALGLSEFVAPRHFLLSEPVIGTGAVQATPPPQTTAGQPLRLRVQVAGAELRDSLLLVAQHFYGRTLRLPMTRLNIFTAEATVPAELLYPGLLRYWVVLKPQDKSKGLPTLTFPGAVPGQPSDWDFYSQEHWEVPIVAAGSPLPLFRAGHDQRRVEVRGTENAFSGWADYVTTPAGELTLRLVVPVPKTGASTSETAPAVSLRAYFADQLQGRTGELAGAQELLVRARTSQPGAAVQVLLVTRNAAAYAAPLTLTADWQTVRIPLSRLQPAPLLITPRPYPGFLPLHFQPATQPAQLRLADAEVLQIVVDGPAMGSPLQVDIESVQLQ